MPEFPYDDSVFINIPFSEDYKDLLYAAVFVVLDCGFIPRCALEDFDSGQVRIDKIFNLIKSSRYGIHDLSYVSLDPDSNLPRFNMPLELGIFIGAQKYGYGKQKDKEYLVLDKEKYRYQSFCSDISGQDIRAHDLNSDGVIRSIRNWLSRKRPKYRYPTWKKIAKRYREFSKELPSYSEALSQDPEDLTFNDYSAIVSDWLKLNSWGAKSTH
jgi:hypothetical protein